MLVFARQTSIMLVALAVMLAGLCCRSGVCLAAMMVMPSGAAMSANSGGNVPPCCALHESGKSVPAGEQKCPLCRQTLVLGKGVDQDHGAAAAMAAVDFALPPIELLPVFSGNIVRLTDTSDLSAQVPHTLLGLHCALIG